MESDVLFSVATASRTGIETRPKEIGPDQIEAGNDELQ
jgi:hypothetical protein